MRLLAGTGTGEAVLVAVLLHGRARQGISKKAKVLAETTRPREKSVEAR